MEQRNALIAEFLGWEKMPNTEFQWWVPALFPYGDFTPKRILSPDEMLFQIDWAWLMVVAEKIVWKDWDGKCQSYSFNVQRELGYAKIGRVYTAIIEFIEYYNSNK